MSFGSGRGSGGAAAPASSGLPPGPRALDLGRFRIAVEDQPRRWSHRIRHFDRGYRVAVPELAHLVGFNSGPLVGYLSPPGWGLRVARGRDLLAGRVEVDERWRVAVPIGVRQRLRLIGSVVVSVALDETEVVVWPAGALDDLLGPRS